MKFHFDESGDFGVPAAPSQNAVGISMGVVIPDETECQILLKFDAFVARLPRSAFKAGEAKGNLLNAVARRRFADFIWGCDSILLCPILLDLTALAGRTDGDIRESVVARLLNIASRCSQRSMRQQVEMLARQFSNLSLVQCLRLATWARCIMRTVHDSLIVHAGPRFHDSWNQLRFEIDPVQRRATNREEQVFNTMVLAWVCAWSENYPFTTIEGVHDGAHPFTQNFGTADGINFGRIIQGNLHYATSIASKGIQIADMAASLVSRATRGVADAVDLQNYGMMMTKSIGKPLKATGLFSFVEPDIENWKRRFYGLPEAIFAAKKSLAGSA